MAYWVRLTETRSAHKSSHEGYQAIWLCLRVNVASYRKHLEDLETGGMTAFLSGIKGKGNSPVSKILGKKQNEEDAPGEEKHTQTTS